MKKRTLAEANIKYPIGQVVTVECIDCWADAEHDHNSDWEGNEGATPLFEQPMSATVVNRKRGEERMYNKAWPTISVELWGNDGKRYRTVVCLMGVKKVKSEQV